MGDASCAGCPEDDGHPRMTEAIVILIAMSDMSMEKYVE